VEKSPWGSIFPPFRSVPFPPGGQVDRQPPCHRLGFPSFSRRPRRGPACQGLAAGHVCFCSSWKWCASCLCLVRAWTSCLEVLAIRVAMCSGTGFYSARSIAPCGLPPSPHHIPRRTRWHWRAQCRAKEVYYWVIIDLSIPVTMFALKRNHPDHVTGICGLVVVDRAEGEKIVPSQKRASSVRSGWGHASR
jgi:hypothetical protein